MMRWKDEHIEALRRWWADGLSAGEIAKKLGEGFTRNAVIGKIHRLGLSSKQAPAKTSPAQLVAAKVNTSPSGTKSAAAMSSSGPSNIVRLSGHSCQWPEGDPRESEFHFCGKAALPGKPYCRDHAVLAYQNFNPDTGTSNNPRDGRHRQRRAG